MNTKPELHNNLTVRMSCKATKNQSSLTKSNSNRETFKRHLRSDMKTLNELSFRKETAFNANRDENYVYY